MQIWTHYLMLSLRKHTVSEDKNDMLEYFITGLQSKSVFWHVSTAVYQ
jgi:hypothetical protein